MRHKYDKDNTRTTATSITLAGRSRDIAAQSVRIICQSRPLNFASSSIRSQPLLDRSSQTVSANDIIDQTLCKITMSYLSGVTILPTLHAFGLIMRPTLR